MLPAVRRRVGELQKELSKVGEELRDEVPAALDKLGRVGEELRDEMPAVLGKLATRVKQRAHASVAVEPPPTAATETVAACEAEPGRREDSATDDRSLPER